MKQACGAPPGGRADGVILAEGAAGVQADPSQSALRSMSRSDGRMEGTGRCPRPIQPRGPDVAHRMSHRGGRLEHERVEGGGPRVSGPRSPSSSRSRSSSRGRPEPRNPPGPPPPTSEPIARPASTCTSCCPTSAASGPRWASGAARRGTPTTRERASRWAASSTCPSAARPAASSPTRSCWASRKPRAIPSLATNPIAYVANLAAGASPAAALAGPPQAPFPVRRDVTLNLRLLQISPFSLKWTFTGLGPRFRPFLAVGGDFLVVITRVDPLADESLAFTGTSPFDDPLIGGLVAQSPELAARGVPSGQGNLELGAARERGLRAAAVAGRVVEPRVPLHPGRQGCASCRPPMPPSASTGSRRRRLLKAAGLVPCGAASPRTGLGCRLRRRRRFRFGGGGAPRGRGPGGGGRGPPAGAWPPGAAARAFAESLLRDQARHRIERDRVRGLLGLEGRVRTTRDAPRPMRSTSSALKAAQEKLTYAMAEALPVLGRARRGPHDRRSDGRLLPPPHAGGPVDRGRGAPCAPETLQGLPRAAGFAAAGPRSPGRGAGVAAPVLALLQGAAPALAKGEDADLGILYASLALEHHAIALYATGPRTEAVSGRAQGLRGRVPGRPRGPSRHAGGHRPRSGAAVRPRPWPPTPSAASETADDLLRQAHLIEEAAQDAYLALISQIRTRDYLLSAGFILVDEVRHLTVWKRVLGLRTW